MCDVIFKCNGDLGTALEIKICHESDEVLITTESGDWITARISIKKAKELRDFLIKELKDDVPLGHQHEAEELQEKQFQEVQVSKLNRVLNKED